MIRMILAFLTSVPEVVWGILTAIAALPLFVIGMAADISERWTIGGDHNRVVGPDLASAATIAPTHMFHTVTGTTQIDNITPPTPTFAGPLFLRFTGIVTVSAAGNVQVAVTTAANEVLLLFYNPATGKWHGGLINNIT